MDAPNKLSVQQRTLLRAFLMQAGPKAIGMSFRVIGRGTTRYLKSGTTAIGLNLTEKELDQLFALGYIQLQFEPLSTVFTDKVLDESIEPDAGVSDKDLNRFSSELRTYAFGCSGDTPTGPTALPGLLRGPHVPGWSSRTPTAPSGASSSSR